MALIIGNADYAQGQLRNPLNDARGMAATLKQLGFEVQMGLNLSAAQMRQMIRDYGRSLKGGAVGLFYYAGHGVQVKGQNYLIPVDADIQSEAEVAGLAVGLDFVLDAMDEAQTELNIVILDACRNNPFASSLRSPSRGLAFIDAPSGTLIAYATRPGAVASDGPGMNGLYTQELLKNMMTPGVSIEDVFKRVRVSVRALTNGQQTPWESSSLIGAFYFKQGIDPTRLGYNEAARAALKQAEEERERLKSEKAQAENERQRAADEAAQERAAREAAETKQRELEAALPNAKIISTEVEHNVEEDKHTGMRINVVWSADNLQGVNCDVAAYFYSADGQRLKDQNNSYRDEGGNVSVGSTAVPTLTNAQLTSKLFIPYTELHIPDGPQKLKFHVQIHRREGGGLLAAGEEQNLEFSLHTKEIDPTLPNAKILSISIEHNIKEDGATGMRINVELDVNNLKDVECQLAAYFRYASGQDLKDFNGKYRTDDNHVATATIFKPTYVNSHVTSKLFIPYAELHVEDGKQELQFNLELQTRKNKELIIDSGYQNLTLDLTTHR